MVNRNGLRGAQRRVTARVPSGQQRSSLQRGGGLHPCASLGSRGSAVRDGPALPRNQCRGRRGGLQTVTCAVLIWARGTVLFGMSGVSLGSLARAVRIRQAHGKDDGPARPRKTVRLNALSSLSLSSWRASWPVRGTFAVVGRWLRIRRCRGRFLR